MTNLPVVPEAGVGGVPSPVADGVERPPRPAPASRATGIKALHAALAVLADEADTLAAAKDLDTLADGLARIREFRKAVSDLERHIEDYVAELMDQEQMIIGDDELTLERRRGKTRKQWRSDELLRHLVGDRLVDPRSGELVFDKLVACLPLTGSLGWRTRALREHGVDPSDWCDEEPARTTVSVKARRVDDD